MNSLLCHKILPNMTKELGVSISDNSFWWAMDTSNILKQVLSSLMGIDIFVSSNQGDPLTTSVSDSQDTVMTSASLWQT